MSDTYERITGFQPVPQSEGWRVAQVEKAGDNAPSTTFLPFVGWLTVETWLKNPGGEDILCDSTVEPACLQARVRSIDEADEIWSGCPGEYGTVELLTPGQDPDWERLKAVVRRREQWAIKDEATRRAAAKKSKKAGRS